MTLVHEAARRQGLGEVRRIYRERNPLWTVQTRVIIGITAVVVLAGAIPDTRWRWPALLLGPVLGAAAVVTYMFLGAVGGVEHRRLIGVSAAGVLVYTEDYGSIPLRWERIAKAVRQPGRYRYVIVERGGIGANRIEFRDIQDGRSLVASIGARGPVPAPVRRRALVGTAIAVVLVLLGAAAFQQAFRVAQVFGSPDKLADFAKVCTEPGSAFRRAAAYAPAAPRPVVIFDEGQDRPSWIGSGPWGPDSPAQVHVVMCVRRSGQGETLENCRYSDPLRSRESRYIDMVQGRYEVTVYAAQTRKKVRVRTLIGTYDECPKFVRSDEDAVYTSLTEQHFHETMSDIVGPP
jgi:hypothetical protein